MKMTFNSKHHTRRIHRIVGVAKSLDSRKLDLIPFENEIELGTL